MNLLRNVIGIDPSARRLALAIHGGGLGRTVMPVVAPLRGDRERSLLDEAETVLGDYVAKNGLAGAAARLCIPADQVFTARVSFPPLRERDLSAALELELERLFPIPASRLVFGWRRIGRAGRGERVTLLVAAAPAAYIEKWREVVARAGLVLSGAIPVGRALSVACEAAGQPDGTGPCAVLRDLGGSVECSLLADRLPFFCAARQCPPETAAADALSLAGAGMADAPVPPGATWSLLGPAGWLRKAARRKDALPVPFRTIEEFESSAARLFSLPASGDAGPPPLDLLGALGAAMADEVDDLLRPPRESAAPRLAGALAALLALATVALAIAWPATVSFRTRAEVARLDAEIAALRPAVAGVESTLTDLTDVERRVETLQQAEQGRDETIQIVRDLTDRLPQGTWLSGLRIEGRKVEMDGLSPAASELFPLLTRDGRFAKVEFASPITRQPDNAERFQIRAEFVPPPKPGAGGAP